jgi:hypothetical protein
VTVADPEGEAAKDGCRLFVNCAAYLLGAGFPDAWNSYTCKELAANGARVPYPIRDPADTHDADGDGIACDE